MRGVALPRARRAVAALVALAATSACVATPDVEDTLERAEAVALTTKVFGADGSLLATLHGEQDRELVPLASVPAHVRDAVIAIEDERFYTHSGVDAKAVVRALFVNAAEGRVVEGGSTITQQYVKHALADTSRTLRRKLREASLAFQLERRLSKDEILERYLNTVYFGAGAYGIQAAAQTFFSAPARKLTLEQGAMLAGLIKSPARFDPFGDPEAATARRNLVLRKMGELDLIGKPRAAAAAASPLGLRPRAAADRYAAPYFVDYVKDLVQRDPRFEVLGATIEERVSSLFKGGLRIHTTLDPRLQRYAEEASRAILTEPSDPYNAFVAMNPRDGSIVAMVGGRDFFDLRDPYAKFNLAVKSRRQPGSSFKTFTLVAALEEGIPLTRIYRGGSRITIRLPGGELWPVRNYETLSFGSRLSLREATIKSVNVVYAQVVRDIGAAKVVDVARRMGITAPLEPFAAIALGAQEVSPLDLASGYSTLADGGTYKAPVAIRSITDAHGKVLWRAPRERRRAIDAAVAAEATEALEDVIERGTGRRLKLGRPAAGKTGTADEYHDAWFAGFTPQMVGVSWVGFPRAQISMVPPTTRIRVVGGSWPGRIWQQFMLRALAGVPAEPFPKVERAYVRVAVDVSRNCIPNRFTPPALVAERSFLAGQEPTGVCTEPSSGAIAATPGVVGRTESLGRAILERAGFRVTVVRRSCPGYLDGTVCAQDPAAGSPATIGDPAVIWVADTQATDGVPRVLGRSEDRARQKLGDHGFEVEVRRLANEDGHPGCRDPAETRSGRVWLQTPCPGASAPIGSRVTIYVVP